MIIFRLENCCYKILVLDITLCHGRIFLEGVKKAFRYIRCHERVQEKFAHIHGIEPGLMENGKNKLVTSFDGLSVIPPCEATKMGWHEGKSKLHCDQGYSTNDFRCVQGNF